MGTTAGSTTSRVAWMGTTAGSNSSQDRKLNEIILVVNQHTAKLDELAAVVNRHDLRLQDLTTDVAGLRETLTHYHATVLGHGILYSELEERVRRIERHLRLEPAPG